MLNCILLFYFLWMFLGKTVGKQLNFKGAMKWTSQGAQIWWKENPNIKETNTALVSGWIKFIIWPHCHFPLCCWAPRRYHTWFFFFVCVKLVHMQTQAWDVKIFLPHHQKYWWGRDTKTENFNYVPSAVLICLLAFSQKLVFSQFNFPYKMCLVCYF